MSICGRVILIQSNGFGGVFTHYQDDGTYRDYYLLDASELHAPDGMTHVMSAPVGMGDAYHLYTRS
jgi:hypothetical protein